MRPRTPNTVLHDLLELACANEDKQTLPLQPTLVLLYLRVCLTVVDTEGVKPLCDLRPLLLGTVRLCRAPLLLLADGRRREVSLPSLRPRSRGRGALAGAAETSGNGGGNRSSTVGNGGGQSAPTVSRTDWCRVGQHMSAMCGRLGLIARCADRTHSRPHCVDGSSIESAGLQIPRPQAIKLGIGSGGQELVQRNCPALLLRGVGDFDGDDERSVCRVGEDS